MKFFHLPKAAYIVMGFVVLLSSCFYGLVVLLGGSPNTPTANNLTPKATTSPSSIYDTPSPLFSTIPTPTLTRSPSPTDTPSPTPSAASTSSPSLPPIVLYTPTPRGTPTPTPGDINGPALAGCPMYPANNAWNQNISSLPVLANSANYIAAINSNKTNLHADFGSDPSYGFPFETVSASQAKVPINFTEYPSESDAGPYPIPNNAQVEGGNPNTAAPSGDSHVLVLQQGTCKLYELYHAQYIQNSWNAGSGAVFDMTSNALRPDGWTSADAAGLPILPGLVRCDEVAAGSINHALRFTVSATQNGYIHPATHYASNSNNPNLPPMGLRLRLNANFDLSGYHGQALVILKALKNYGMIVADNGSSWFISGQTSTCWDDNDLNQLKSVPGSAFEAVNTGPILH